MTTSTLKKTVRCAFTSVWSGGAEITTSALYDPETGKVETEALDVDPDGCLLEEKLTLADGTEVQICTTCHEYTLQEDGKTCRNPSCAGEK